MDGDFGFSVVGMRDDFEQLRSQVIHFERHEPNKISSRRKPRHQRREIMLRLWFSRGLEIEKFSFSSL